jgi:hypothetical protein
MLLDEVDNAELGDLFTVKDFMVHFRLKKAPDGIDDMFPVELEEFGEDTLDMLSEQVYPVFSKAVMDVDKDWPDDEQQVPPEKWDAGMNAPQNKCKPLMGGTESIPQALGRHNGSRDAYFGEV